MATINLEKNEKKYYNYFNEQYKGGFCMAFLFKRTDKPMITAVIILSFLSVLLLYSISAMKFEFLRSDSYLVQVFAISVGILIAFIISIFDYRKFARLWYIYVPIAVFLVFLTYTDMGVTVNGNRAWLNIKGFTFQPAELLKIAFILSFAYHLSTLGKKNMNKFSNFIKLCIHGAVPILMVIAQADDGTALVFVFIFVFMMLFAGLSWKYILAGIVALPAFAILLWAKVLTDYQKDRFLIIFDLYSDPDGLGYQQIASRKSILNSGLFGKGLFDKNYSYVAEMDTDFIFSFTAQALGYIGLIVIILFYLFILCRILKSGFDCNNILGKNICVGIFAMFFFHITVNIAMNFGYAPVIGLPLPFLSAGGTYVIISYICMGIVLSVCSHTGKSYKSKNVKRRAK